MKVSELLTRYLVDLAERVGFVWERTVARYRDKATGRFVSEFNLIKLQTDFTEYARSNIGNITERLVSGNLDIGAWQKQFAQELKDAYVVNYQIARGGKNAMTQADYGRIGGRLKAEYKYLDNFAQEIASGKLTPEQIRARANQYVAGTRTAYYDGKTAAGSAAGFTEERRILNPAEHCEDCIGFAAQGWQPIGTLPEPGTGSRCRHNCKCEKEYK
jgi:hypothetical protein